MKKGARLLAIILFLSIIPFRGTGQDCVPFSKANDITPDQLCSPVEVLTWEVKYTGVNNAGTPVTINFVWDDGTSETLPTVESPAGTFTSVANHTYVSDFQKCNYRPVATLIVNGVTCTSQSQEQIVTIWDVDNKNGAYVNASPNVYPICIGEGATMRFNDDTRYNCVPPQENDNRNESTRWIQWVYGTNSAAGNFMTGNPVSVNGYPGPWPYTTAVKTLPGPSWGSSEQSLPIFVDDDKLLGQEFEVELRYWNYCNKYTDGKPPVIDRSVIRIVNIPDATIDPVDTLCEFGSSVFLTAATGGGNWSGAWIVDAATGEFSPSVAGPGTHVITYSVTDGNSCTAMDTENIVVRDAPDGTITPVDPFCFDDPPYDMEAATTQGTWSGTGITNPATGIFSPAVAGLGSHRIIFVTATDHFGCFGTDTTDLHVVPPPFAAFITPDSSWCEQATNHSVGKITFTGNDTSLFDLVYKRRGIVDTLPGLPLDTVDLFLNNVVGVNEYILLKVIEHHGGNSCETPLADTLTMTVNPIPEATMEMEFGDLCSPVPVQFTSEPGFKTYSWDFGDGVFETMTNQTSGTFTFDYSDNMTIVGEDTIYDLSRDDSVFVFHLKVETDAGCTDSVTRTLTVYPVPDADFFVYPEVQKYPDSSVFLTNLTSVGNWSYLWDYGDGEQDNPEDPGQHDYDTYGVFDIQLQAFSPYCRDSITRTIQILPPPPVATFWPDTVGCPPLLVHFNNESQYADSYIWDFDDNTYSTESNPSHLFYQHKEHYVRLAAIGLSGTDTTIRIVYVYERPRADFDVYPTQSSNLKQVFKFSNSSSNARTYMWDFGDGRTSSEKEPAHIYEDSGTYTVSLYVWSKEDCPDTIVRENLITVVAGEGSVDFPNAFVWNGSGPSGGHWEEHTIDNTVFHPAVINAKEFRMIIYTRWGEKIFETNDLYVGWDGYLQSGNLATEGVYFYRAWVTYVDGTEEELAGDITFLH
jgi:PKD repeat protein